LIIATVKERGGRERMRHSHASRLVCTIEDTSTAALIGVPLLGTELAVDDVNQLVVVVVVIVFSVTVVIMNLTVIGPH
jgi:hypothetical protein